MALRYLLSLATVADYYSCDGSPSIVNLDITIARTTPHPPARPPATPQTFLPSADKVGVLVVVVSHIAKCASDTICIHRCERNHRADVALLVQARPPSHPIPFFPQRISQSRFSA
jgi:hypothetical protein